MNDASGASPSRRDVAGAHEGRPKKRSRRRHRRSKVTAEAVPATPVGGHLGSAPVGRAPWWYELVLATTRSQLVDPKRSIYTNRTLRFDRIGAVGFDFDHTLAIYNCENLDRLAMEMVIDRLIEHEKLPKSYFGHLPDPSFARKGLLVDKIQGTVIKSDRYGHVTHAYRAGVKLSTREKRELYGDMDVIPHVTDGDRFVQVDTAFAKPEVMIFTSVAPHLEQKERREFWQKLRDHTDAVHRDGSLKKVITANPFDYVTPDHHTVAMLRALREGGKKVFLLTNSEWEYTKAMANPALGLGGDPEDLAWTELFDLVVVHGRKPGYFNAKKKREAIPVEVPGASADAPRVLAGGTITDLEQRFGSSGPEFLYVGDHIYADLISSKRQKSWRTMLVISELEEELDVQGMLPGIVAQLKQTDDLRFETEREVMRWKSIERALSKVDDPARAELLTEIRNDCAEYRQQASRTLREFIQQREGLRSKLSRATNSYWGSLFRAGTELTYYGRQLEDFACIYSARATNLLYYPADHYFRSSMDYLPHELEQL
ncbi:MAG: HAD-IG family 5'-nucleotidase [Planctomycetes bacterium]|nr:HAD-IG family 5'-nucleotidase [Planctomycetota bacterium]